MDEDEIGAWVITFAELDGAEFDWNRGVWKERR